jgi:demethylsterigmatocystin 6-O-methyltransferase
MVGLKPDQAFFIDLGGGIGHQSIALRQKVPQLPSNIIVQDIPATLQHAIKYPGVETMVQDFFQPQVVNGRTISWLLCFKPHLYIKTYFSVQWRCQCTFSHTGARIYYMRNVIHDYPDERALIILKNTRAALGPDSVILIDDMVVPNSGAHWYVTQCDLVMMAGLAAMERTKDQWYSLLERAGLKINKIYTYTTSLQDSVIECVAADGEGEAGSRI